MDSIRALVYPTLSHAASGATDLNYCVVHFGATKNIPRHGPCFLAMTHSNMSCDGGILLATVAYGRQCHMWMKSSLFGTPASAFFFEAAGAVPVQRRLDTPGLGSSASVSVEQPPNNAGLWLSTKLVLAKGGLLCVFPEGTSYHLPHMITIRRGLANSALDFANSGGSTLPIVPVGVTYLEKLTYRSLAIATYGKPILVVKDSTETAAELTQRISAAMLDVTVNAPDWNTLEAAQTAFQLLCPGNCLDLEDYVPLLQAFVAVFMGLGRHHEIEPLKQACTDYRKTLAEYSTSDNAVASFAGTDAGAELNRAMFVLMFKAPLLLPALVIYSPLVASTVWLRSRELYLECKAQILGLSAIFLVPLLSIVATLLLAHGYGTSYIFAVLVVTGAATIYHAFLDSTINAYRSVCALAALRLAGSDVRKILIEQRRTLCRSLVSVLVNADTGICTRLNLETYVALPYGPFKKETSVPAKLVSAAGSKPFPEPQHIELARPGLECVLAAIDTIRRQVNKVDSMHGVDKDGVPTATGLSRSRAWFRGRRVWML